MKISIYGIVYVVIYSRVDDRFIRFIDVYIMEIMRWYSQEREFGFYSIKGNKVEWEVIGECFFRFGVE